MQAGFNDLVRKGIGFVVTISELSLSEMKQIAEIIIFSYIIPSMKNFLTVAQF
jgi:hypothetical protein